MPALAHVDALRAAPITGVHLWFDRPVCPFDHVVTPGRLIQWVFSDRRSVKESDEMKESTEAEAYRLASRVSILQLVISASYDLLALDKLAIRDAVLADLAAIWPAVSGGATVAVVGRHRTRGHLRRPPGVESSGLRSARRSTGSSWLATGPIPAGRPRWRGQFGAATWPLRGS